MIRTSSSSGTGRGSGRSECRRAASGGAGTEVEVFLGRLAGRGAAIGIGSSLPAAGVVAGCAVLVMD